ncbi:conserved hypothetical protein containing HTH do main [Formosa agariphila KMM 3901]|uniref:Uncharacterized protein n=1 Tax=Formosa agariphila (strain DSM 15362 / KCTC 12365 / LMG 23005 / KMM 3901 / M-2Alg 35-1) TaxID=1347342 RepID=T2KN12_FORAG|nr:hypothetical protein [Formosa agariphila]CDF80292.1 conserved hypothetical protein containing HTH do main [Formosa agariphila KMM 3901]
MNYIKHLNAIFKVFQNDPRLNPSHISLYMALFQYWNYKSFQDTIFISREDIMNMSKLGSKTTYHRCIKNLSDWKYLLYLPSHNPYKGSQIKMFKFDTSTKQAVDKHKTSSVQALVPILNLNKQNRNFIQSKLPKNENEVLVFFKSKNWPTIEAQKFYNHNQAIGWTIGGKSKVENWQALASNWMIKAAEIEKKSAASHFKDNLITQNNKDYDQPL